MSERALPGRSAKRAVSNRSDDLRRLLRRALNDPGSLRELEPRQLDLTLRLMRRAQLLGRLASQLRRLELIEAFPHPVPDILLSALAAAETRARVARWELDRLTWALQDAPDTPLVLLKGCAYMLARTPNAAGRTFGDVDLLVAESALPTIESLLIDHGWLGTELSAYDEHYYRHWAHELPPLTHREREVEVDLHHNILMRTARLKPSAALLLGDARRHPGSRFSVLSPVDMCLHAMTHLLYSGEMESGLRELVDIAELLRHCGDNEPGFWAAFWPRAERLDLARPAYYGLRYARRLLGAPVPDSVLAASASAAPPAPIGSLMDRLIPTVLFPVHPDRSSTRTEAARLLMFVRQHWLRMPPLLLARHLGYKAWLRLRA